VHRTKKKAARGETLKPRRSQESAQMGRVSPIAIKNWTTYADQALD